MRVEHSNARSRTAPMLTAALVTFAVGLSCGWLLKPLMSGGETASNSSSPDAFPAENRIDFRAAGASDEEASKFISRLADALSIESRSKRERAFAAIADDLDAAQLPDALAQLEKTRIANRAEVCKQLLAHWAELDPEAARDYALALPDGAQRREAVNAVVSGWMEQDANSAIKWVEALADGPVKNSALQTLIQTIAATDPKSAFMLLQNSLSFVKAGGVFGEWPNLIDSIFSQWAETDPQDAAAATAQLDDSGRNAASFAVAARWAKTDLASALAWAQSQPNDWAKRRLPEGEFGLTSIFGVLQTWMNSDAIAATKWLEELPDGTEKTNLIQSACMKSDFADPAPQLDLALMMPDGTAREDALRSIIGNWARYDPGGVCAWSAAQEDERLQQNTLKAVATEWFETDPQGAIRWIASLPSGAEKDGVVSSAIDNLLEGEPVGNWEWTSSVDLIPGDGFRQIAQLIAEIRGAPERQSASEKLARIWLRKNPDAARAWLDTSTLPAVVKAQLLQPEKARQPQP